MIRESDLRVDREETGRLLPGAEQGTGENHPGNAGVRGNVVEETTGVPLGKILIRWMAPGGRSPRHAAPAVELGRALSAADGSFAIQRATTAEAEEALCLLKHRPRLKSYLLVDDGPEDGESHRFVVDSGQPEMLLRVAQGAEPEAESWRSLADYLMANRMLRASDLARELSAPSSDSSARFWSAATRAGGLRAIGAALADDAPGLKLLDQDHFLEFHALEAGDLVKALKEFKDGIDIRERIEVDVEFGDWLKLPKSDTELYRDYLRGVWVTAAQQMYRTTKVGAIAADVPSEDILLRQLDTRFHQDFRTSDNVRKPAATLLIEVLREALLADATRDGFGLAPAALPAQGAQADDEYLATLIGLSNVDAVELRNRYRVDFERLPGTRISPVDLNVETLLGLLADTWQSPEEPFPAEPPGRDRLPLIFAPYLGRAPFFLYYEEWLERQKKFYPENIYDIRRNLPVFHETVRKRIEEWKTASTPVTSWPNQMDYFPTLFDRQKSAAWLGDVIAIVDLIRAALASADLRDYPKALAQFDDVENRIEAAFNDKRFQNAWYRDRFDWLDENDNWNTDFRVSLEHRAKRSVKTPAELAAFEGWFDDPYNPGTIFVQYKELARLRTLSIWWLYYAFYVLVPYLRSQILITLSDYGGALRHLGELTGYEVGIAETTTAPGYKPARIPSYQSSSFYAETTLPYTTAVGFDDQRSYDDLKPSLDVWNSEETRALGQLIFYSKRTIAPFEQRFFKLAQGEVMLDWADQLYRNDDPSSIRRARELFKGVLFMHGQDVEIAPHFAAQGWSGQGIGLLPDLFPLKSGQENPARASQLRRARLALWQIEEGLNAYGFREDMVPVLRYQPLKQAADLFATSAKSAQTDFIGYTTRFEQARIEGWQASAMVKKAEAGAGIAREQVEIAEAGVAKAQEQVAAVKAQIAAKQQEIADKNSLFEQAKDFFGGMKDSMTGMVSSAQKLMNDDSPAGAATSDQLKGVLSKSFAGSSAMKDTAAASLGAGAAFTVGFAAFAYYGYTTMSSMADAANTRIADLKGLREVALPAAEAQVKLKQRDVTIANLQKDIAEADLDLAKALLRFQRDRFLNVDLWNKLAAFAQRLMRRYIDLGARYAWFAERALAYQQASPVDIIRLNYFPTALRGLTGADRLLADLAELEANRLQSIRLATPVKHTVSLARDFPLQFGRLKRAGRTVLQTRESGLRAAYPGTFAYRIRAVSVAAQDSEGPPPCGMLKNLGVSALSNRDGSPPRILARFPDALPLSEFRLREDLFVYGLPGEALLQFEGGGFESDWEIELPLAANPKGLTTLTDVLITFDMNASYVWLPAPVAGVPVPVTQSVAVSASIFDSPGLASLHGTGAEARIRFDLRKVPLRKQEQNRKIANLAVILVGSTKKTYSATLGASLSATLAAFPIEDGYGLSNAGPLLGTNPALPLNAFVALPVDQVFTLEIDRSGVADELKALFDVVLYIEYTAEL